jgi:hypothetical protein
VRRLALRGGAGGRARWVTAGLVDQVVIASANAANTLLALALLDRTRAGIMLLSLGLAYLVMGISRAFVGEVLLALASRYDAERRERLVRQGLGTAATIGLLAAVILFVVWLVWPARGDVDLRDLVWVAPLLPMILLHDTGRYSYLAAREPAKALVIDLVWVGTQAVAVAVMIATGLSSAGGLFVCWGLGAAAGASVFLLRSGFLRGFRLGDPRQWFAVTRHLSGWFTATALIGQFQVQAVGFLVAGQLSARELSGLRGAQTAVLQPVQNFNTALMGLLVPRASRLAGDASRLAGDSAEAAAAAAAGLRRQTRLLALAFAGLAALMVAVVVPVARTLLVHIPKFADIAPLALPMSIQAGIYLVQLPVTSAMRGMHRARMLFVQYVIFTATSLSGLVIGAHLDRLPGAAWGLTVGAAAGLAVMIGLYAYALRWLGDRSADRFATADDDLAPIAE